MAFEAGWHVRIMAPDGSRVAGAGVLVNLGRVVTCAHVISEALGTTDTTDVPTGMVRVDFPQGPDGSVYEARVISNGWFPERATAGDLAMLEILGAEPAVAPAPLRLAGQPGHRMISVLGHPPGQDIGVWARAMLIGRGGPRQEWIQLDAIRSTGKRIEKGYSGAGVWDEENEAVIGCLVATDRSQQDRVAWMIPVEVLVHYWPDLRELVQRAPSGARWRSARPEKRKEKPSIAAAERQRIAAALLALRGIRDRATRDLFIDVIERDFAGRLHVERISAPIDATLALVDTCLAHPGALHELLQRLRRYHDTEPERPLLAELTEAIEIVDPAPLLSIAERNALYRVLDELRPQIAADRVLSTYRQAAGQLGLAEIDPFDLPSVLRRLEAATSDPDGLPPLITFLEELSQFLPQQTVDGLRTWVNDFAGRENIPRHLILRLRISRPPTAPSSAIGYVLIELRPDGADDQRYMITVTLRHPEVGSPIPQGQVLHESRTPLTIAEIPDIFDSVLSRVWEAASLEIDQLVIEFLLPFSLLSYPVDQWEVQTDQIAHPVGVEHLVVIRVRDRQDLRRTHAQWREKSRRLRAGQATVRWVDPLNEADISTRLFADLVAGGAQCLALVRPPQPAQSLGNDAVSVGVWTGVPVMVWCRDESSATSFTALLRDYFERHDLTSLPSHIQRMRRDFVRFGDPAAGAHITLVWDLEDEPISPAIRYRAPAG
jgi:hypothetical protein